MEIPRYADPEVLEQHGVDVILPYFLISGVFDFEPPQSFSSVAPHGRLINLRVQRTNNVNWS